MRIFIIPFTLKKRFCPQSGALKRELGNAPSIWRYGECAYGEYANLYPLAMDAKFEGSIRLRSQFSAFSDLPDDRDGQL